MIYIDTAASTSCVTTNKWIVNDWCNTTPIVSVKGAWKLYDTTSSSSLYKITTGCEWEDNSITWSSGETTWPDSITWSSGESYFWYPDKQETLKSRFQSILANRRFPAIIVKNDRRTPMVMPADVREQRARETLKRVIGDKKFFNFLKSGFLSVKAKSGLVYQIFPGHGITCVFNQGQLVERLCVVLQGGFPPTDSLIMRYLLILNSEQTFRGYAISHTPRLEVYQEKPIDNRPITEIFKELKNMVA